MRNILAALIIFGVTILYGQGTCDRVVSGKILDIDTNEPLPYATVQVVDKNLGAVADENGDFIIRNICDDEIHLEVRFLGYKTITHHHDFHHSNPVIYLASDQTLLEGVIVEESLGEELKSISVSKKKLDNLSIVSTSIGNLTGDISGVSLLQTGTNISKPIVHGLHSNRVLVINDGVRHAYQVWGQEHAPEIDPSHIDQIEVVKGAGTVKYGPDALGGVILYNSSKPAFDKSLNGTFSSGLQSNGKSITSQVNVSQGSHRFAWNVGAYGTYQGDLKAPDYLLSNTGKREFGGSFNTLLHKPKYDLQITGSFIQQDLGLLRASIVGNLEDLQRSIERGVPSPTFPFSYSIQNPRQETTHAVTKTNLSVYLDKHIFNFQYAFQYNARKEFDVRRGELNNRPVIDLGLTSHTLDAEWVQPEKGSWSGNSGIQFFHQNSKNTPGSNPVNFVPDYKVFNVGVFSVQSLDVNTTTLELGLRADFQSLAVSDVVRNTFSYSNEVCFSNGTFTVGVNKQITEEFMIFSNIGSAWRAPNVAELYSFGYHNSRLQFGLWRYELEPEISTPVDAVFDENDREVPVEKGLKWVAGLEIRKPKATAEFVFYANQINNYIFQRPFGVSTGIAGTFPFFFYDQTDALLLGSDWDIQYQHSKKISSEIRASYVYARRTQDGQLLEIPPLNVTYDLNHEGNNWNYGFRMSYTAQAWNAPPVIEPISFQTESSEINLSEIFDFMAPPKAYFLAGIHVGFQKNQWKTSMEIANVLNESYRNYTDRLRYFADAPGRNITLSFEYSF